jgi:hypothetical protein
VGSFDVKVLEKLLRERCKNDSLFLARLTPDEYQRFMDAKIPYSGSTGKHFSPGLYSSANDPYIATFLFTLEKSKKALHWKRTRLELRGERWFLTKWVRPPAAAFLLDTKRKIVLT